MHLLKHEISTNINEILFGIPKFMHFAMNSHGYTSLLSFGLSLSLMAFFIEIINYNFKRRYGRPTITIL